MALSSLGATGEPSQRAFFVVADTASTLLGLKADRVVYTKSDVYDTVSVKALQVGMYKKGNFGIRVFLKVGRHRSVLRKQSEVAASGGKLAGVLSLDS